MSELNNKLPKVYDIELFKQFYQNILMHKQGNKGPALNTEILKSLRILDEQDHINKGKWYSLPYGTTQRLVERIVYYKGRGAMFYWQDKFWFLPFAPCGSIDAYGRYTKITPIPFNGTAKDKDKERPLLDGLEFEPIYDVIMPYEFDPKMMETKCVILNDYSPQLSQNIQARANLSEPLLQVMAECVPFMRTSLINGTGVNGIKVQSEDEAWSVLAASDATVQASLNGDKWVPINGGLNMDMLQFTSPSKAEEYLLAMQSLDNLRLSLHGLDNGGIFQKKSHMLEAEQEMNAGVASLAMQDFIYQRQEFCTLCNSLWGLGMWYEASEPNLGVDANGDGLVYDDYSDNTTHNEDIAAAQENNDNE